jgi:hypothetical protein
MRVIASSLDFFGAQGRYVVGHSFPAKRKIRRNCFNPL